MTSNRLSDDSVLSFQEFCPVMWNPSLFENRDTNICAFSNKKDPEPVRPGEDSDVMYGCYLDSCPSSLQGWKLIMADKMDSNLCTDETIYLGRAFDNGSCLKSRVPPASITPQPSSGPTGNPPASGAQGSPVPGTGFIVGSIAMFVLLLVCLVGLSAIFRS